MITIIIRFLKRIFAPIMNNFKGFRSILLNSNSLIKGFYLKNNKVINIILYTLLGYMSYYFVYDLNISNAIQIFIFTIFSFAISMYISDNFNFSNNIFIKILQKIVFKIIKFALIIFIFYLFDISILNTIYCNYESDDEVNNNDEDDATTKTEDKDVVKASTSTENKDKVEASTSTKEKDVVHITSSKEEGDEEYYKFKIKNIILKNESINDLFILPFLHKKTPNWLIIIIILAILILYQNPFNVVDYILNIKKSYVLIFFIIAQFTLCIEYLIYLFLINILYHNKIILSNNLPKFINNKLLHFNNLSKYEKDILFKDYKLMIKVYLSIILFEVIVICLGLI